MTASGLLDHLTRHGALLACDGEALRCEAPPGFVTPELLAEIRRQKPALVALLAEAPTSPRFEVAPPPGPAPFNPDEHLSPDFDAIAFGAEPPDQFLGHRTVGAEEFRDAVRFIGALNRAATANP